MKYKWDERREQLNEVGTSSISAHNSSGPESLKIKNFILPTILNIEVVSSGKAIETVPFMNRGVSHL